MEIGNLEVSYEKKETLQIYKYYFEIKEEGDIIGSGTLIDCNELYSILGEDWVIDWEDEPIVEDDNELGRLEALVVNHFLGEKYKK